MTHVRQVINGLGRRILPTAVVVAAMLAGRSESHAQPDNVISGGDSRIDVVRGNIEVFTIAAGGEIDGAVLDNESETILHWPIGLNDRLSKLIKPRDRIRAIGRRFVNPVGDVILQVKSITNLRTKETVEDPEFAPDRPPAVGLRSTKEPKEGSPRPAARDRAAAVDQPSLVTVRGDVEGFTKAPDGQADGVVLDNENETVLNWPGRLQDRFAGILQLGDRVRATGRRATSARGNSMIIVKSLTNLRTKETVENPDFAPPVTPSPAAAPGAATAVAADREQRLRRLEEQVEQLRREIERLRNGG